MLTLVTVIYGTDRRYRVELFGSVLSALKLREQPDTRIVVYTDRHLEDFPLPITERIIEPDEWHSWTRGSGITHLVKLHLVRKTLEESNGPVIYFDTDTLFLAPPETIAARLSPATSLMHAGEGPIAGHDIWATIATWLGDGRDVCGIALSDQSIMYNSGIVGVVPEHRDALLRSVDVADTLYDIDPVFSLDQFSTSAALSHQTQIATCEQDVLHYWGWNRAFIRDALDVIWQRSAEQSVPDLCAEFEPTRLVALPAIQLSDKLRARLLQFRLGLNQDGRFACVALLSALRQATKNTAEANRWFTIHLDFMARQGDHDKTAAQRISNAFSSDYEACRAWLDADNTAATKQMHFI